MELLAKGFCFGIYLWMFYWMRYLNWPKHARGQKCSSKSHGLKSYISGFQVAPTPHIGLSQWPGNFVDPLCAEGDRAKLVLTNYSQLPTRRGGLHAKQLLGALQHSCRHDLDLHLGCCFCTCADVLHPRHHVTCWKYRMHHDATLSPGCTGIAVWDWDYASVGHVHL